MKIGLLGYGKMGKMVELAAKSRGYAIVDAPQADVFIDFSHPDAVLKHVNVAISQKKPIIIGTTGWGAKIPEVKALVEKSTIGALFSPNFSLGMAIFIKLLEQARASLRTYELAGVEYHHSQKKDAPSGTAIQIASKLGMKTPFASVRCGTLCGKHEVHFDSPFDTITLTHEAHNREGFAQGAVTAALWILDKKGWFTLDDMLHSTHYPI